MIPVKIEPKDTLFYNSPEKCCFCRETTHYWTNIKSRTLGQQVACCPKCAKGGRVNEVPTKAEWIDRERSLKESVC
jgi:hypothetical protein